MHILRLTPHFYWPQFEDVGWPVRFDTIGGMQTQLYRLSASLSSLAVDQTALTLKIPGAPSLWSATDRVTVRGVRVPLFPFRSRFRGMLDLNPSWALGCLKAVITKRVGDVDAVHVHASGVVAPLLTGYLVARLLRVPLVASVHCSILCTYVPMNWFDKLLRPVSLAVEKRVLRSAGRTIFLTPTTREKYLEAGWLTPEQTAIIPDAIDTQAFAALNVPDRRQGFLERFPELKNKKLVTYVGRIAHEKGWPRLLELLERLDDPNVHLLVCGDGNERESMQQLIERKGLSHRVTITGYLAQTEVPVAMAVSEVLVLVSHHEEFGGVMLEGMAVGTPSVAFAVGGIPAVQKAGETGLLAAPDDLDDLAAQVKRLLDDADLRQRLAAAGRAHVSEVFDIGYAAQRTRDIYEEVVEARCSTVKAESRSSRDRV